MEVEIPKEVETKAVSIHILEFPDDVIWEIIKWCSPSKRLNLALTCKHIRKLWIEKTAVLQVINDESIRMFPNIKAIKGVIKNETFTKEVPFLPKLQYIYLMNTSKEAMNLINKHSTQLLGLEVTGRALEPFIPPFEFHTLTKLTYLCMVHYFDVNGDKSFLSNLTNLRVLEIRKLPPISFEGLTKLTRLVTRAIMPHTSVRVLTNLKTLDAPMENVSEFRSLLSNLTRLQTLTIQRSMSFGLNRSYAENKRSFASILAAFLGEKEHLMETDTDLPTLLEFQPINNIKRVTGFIEGPETANLFASFEKLEVLTLKIPRRNYVNITPLTCLTGLTQLIVKQIKTFVKDDNDDQNLYHFKTSTFGTIEHLINLELLELSLNAQYPTDQTLSLNNLTKLTSLKTSNSIRGNFPNLLVMDYEGTDPIDLQYFSSVKTLFMPWCDQVDWSGLALFTNLKGLAVKQMTKDLFINTLFLTNLKRLDFKTSTENNEWSVIRKSFKRYKSKLTTKKPNKRNKKLSST